MSANTIALSLDICAMVVLLVAAIVMPEGRIPLSVAALIESWIVYEDWSRCRLERGSVKP